MFGNKVVEPGTQSTQRKTAIDQQALAGDETRLVGEQPDHRVSNFLRLTDALQRRVLLER